MAHSKHTIKAFDSDLDELARAIAEMGGVAERQIAEATAALTTRDGDRARRMIAADAMIDAMQRNIEERAVDHCAASAGSSGLSEDYWNFAVCEGDRAHRRSRKKYRQAHHCLLW